MSTIFIIHGVGGHPKENWFPWLRQELEQLGKKVIIPQFPTPENQTLSSWLQTFEPYKDLITAETIFIGHSLGVAFILNLLEKYPAKAAILVSGFVGKVGNQFEDSMKTFAERSFDWQEIKNNCKNFLIFHSDNDPYVKLEKAHELADYLGAKVRLVPSGGHFNSDSGYTSFELLLDKIKELL